MPLNKGPLTLPSNQKSHFTLIVSKSFGFSKTLATIHDFVLGGKGVHSKLTGGEKKTLRHNYWTNVDSTVITFNVDYKKKSKKVIKPLAPVFIRIWRYSICINKKKKFKGAWFRSVESPPTPMLPGYTSQSYHLRGNIGIVAWPLQCNSSYLAGILGKTLRTQWSEYTQGRNLCLTDSLFVCSPWVSVGRHQHLNPNHCRRCPGWLDSHCCDRIRDWSKKDLCWISDPLRSHFANQSQHMTGVPQAWSLDLCAMNSIGSRQFKSFPLQSESCFVC